MASQKKAKNILGTDLQACCFDPMTGFFRDGFCNTNQQDRGTHTVCAVVTKEFLDYTRSKGNDLSTPYPPHFPGLKPGDGWCLCAMRWREAHEAGKAPPIKPEATHEKTLEYVPLEILEKYYVKNERSDL